MTRTFRDGHAETWRAADATLGWWGPDGFTRLVAVTADPGILPDAGVRLVVLALGVICGIINSGDRSDRVIG